MTFLYICDRKQCENCSDECKHTSNILHAVNNDARNFSIYGEGIFEDPPDRNF